MSGMVGARAAAVLVGAVALAGGWVLSAPGAPADPQPTSTATATHQSLAAPKASPTPTPVPRSSKSAPELSQPTGKPAATEQPRTIPASPTPTVSATPRPQPTATTASPTSSSAAPTSSATAPTARPTPAPVIDAGTGESASGRLPRESGGGVPGEMILPGDLTTVAGGALGTVPAGVQPLAPDPAILPAVDADSTLVWLASDIQVWPSSVVATLDQPEAIWALLPLLGGASVIAGAAVILGPGGRRPR